MSNLQQMEMLEFSADTGPVELLPNSTWQSYTTAQRKATSSSCSCIQQFLTAWKYM